MTAETRVTVVMAAHDAADHLPAAIASLAAQTIADWELVIVDDASSDATSAVAASACARDPRIRAHRLNANRGPAGARNVGFAEARGRFITVLDADDSYRPDRLERLLAVAQATKADVVADNFELFDPVGRAVVCAAFALGGETIPLTAARLVANDSPPRISSLGQLKPFIRADFWRASGVRYPEAERLGEDFVFLLRLLQRTDRAVLTRYAGYVYTLPFGLAAGERSAASRTDYGAGKFERTIRLNAALAAEAGDDTALRAALIERGQRLRAEKNWRRFKVQVKKRRFAQAARFARGLTLGFALDQAALILRRRRGRYETAVR